MILLIGLVNAYSSYLHARVSEQGKVIGVGVHIYVDPKKLNCTLAIDFLFKHEFVLGLLVKYMD